MLKRTGLVRAIVIAMVGVVLGASGVVGQSVAQTEGMKKDDTMKAGDKTMKSDGTMMKGDKTGDMKSDDMKKDGKAIMKDDKMMPGDKTMEKKQ